MGLGAVDTHSKNHDDDDGSAQKADPKCIQHVVPPYVYVIHSFPLKLIIIPFLYG